MKIRLSAALFLTTLLVAPLSAELKYTMHIEARPSAAPAAASPLAGVIGNIVVSTIAPAGGLDVTVTVGDHGARMDYARAYMIIPAGGAAIVRADGTMVVLDPATRTYWKMTKPDLSAFGAAGGPKVTLTRTGEFADVAGVRAERAALEIHLPLPVPPGAQLPPGIPAEIAMTGDAWVAAKYKAYAKAAAGLLGGANVLGLDTIANEGFMMRTVLHGDLLGDHEIESVVTSIGEASVPPSFFEVPAGFTEVHPPASAAPALAGPK